MKLRTLSIFSAAAIVSLAACGGGDDAGGGATADSTAVSADSGMIPPAPVTPDTTMAPPVVDSAAMPMDSAGGDTVADTTAKM